MVLIQITLSGSRPRDYEYLTQFMERSGWKTKLADESGKDHWLAPGTYVGKRDDPSCLAAILQAEIRKSGLDDGPIVLTAVIQDWKIVS